MRGTIAEIEFDCRRAREGERVKVHLGMHNRWPWPLWGLAIENGFFLNDDENETRPVAALASVPGWSRSAFVFEFRPDTRGIYPHAATVLATGFPFGIWRASTLINVKRELLVWPRTIPLTSIPSLRGIIADVIGSPSLRPGDEQEVVGGRPFRDGDRLRNIHWAQTARRDTLFVNERQALARRLVSIVVDCLAFSGDDWPRQKRMQLETAIRVAASIAQEFHSHHAEVRFVMGDLDLHLPAGAPTLQRLLDAIARFRIELKSTDERMIQDEKSLTFVVTQPRRPAAWPQGRLPVSATLALVLGLLPVAGAACLLSFTGDGC
ncbi:MAG: DUF58 domain-containing protein [Pirellulaceae bacterium]|nr:DUF58 domain-containing protein [Planctomycetales bacterium]MCA9263876.1 DUF58 domain-containing protein [Planctomycetales bacterium]